MEGINANDKIYKMSFSKVYPLLVTKCEKKGRTREEVDQVTCWFQDRKARRTAPQECRQRCRNAPRELLIKRR